MPSAGPAYNTFLALGIKASQVRKGRVSNCRANEIRRAKFNASNALKQE